MNNKGSQFCIHIALSRSHWQAKVSRTEIVILDLLFSYSCHWKMKKKEKEVFLVWGWLILGTILFSSLSRCVFPISLPHLLGGGFAVWLALANDTESKMPCVTPRPKHLIPVLSSLLPQSRSLVVVVTGAGRTSGILGPTVIITSDYSSILHQPFGMSKNETLLF